MAVWTLFVVFVSVPLIEAAPLPAVPPVKPLPEGGSQLYNTPEGIIPSTPLAGVTLKPVALQVATPIAVMAGIGFTVITTENVGPTQLPVEGVTV